MSQTSIIWAILLSAGITFGLRALPFLFFGKMNTIPGWIDRLGKNLPAAIMAILVIYCLKDAASNPVSFGIPSLSAVLVVAVTYKWKHNTFFSILAGTACNMILMRVM